MKRAFALWSTPVRGMVALLVMTAAAVVGVVITTAPAAEAAGAAPRFVQQVTSKYHNGVDPATGQPFAQPFELTAVVHGNPTPKVAWQWRAPGGAWRPVVTDGNATVTAATTPDGLAVNAKVTLNPSREGYGALFRIVASNSEGTTYSNSVELAHVTQGFELQPTVYRFASPYYYLRAIATGAPIPHVRWEYRLPSDRPATDADWIAAPGRNVTTLTSRGEATMRFVPQTAGERSWIWSAAFTDAVTGEVRRSAELRLPVSEAAAPEVTQQPQSTVLIEPGSSVTLFSAASGWAPPTISWQTSSDGGVTFTDYCATGCGNSISVALPDAQAVRQVRARFQNSSGTVYSDVVTLRLVGAPVMRDRISEGIRYPTAGDEPTLYTSVSGRESGLLEYWPTVHYRPVTTHPATGALSVPTSGWEPIPPELLRGRVDADITHGFSRPGTVVGTREVVRSTNWATYTLRADDPLIADAAAAGAAGVQYTMSWWGCAPKRVVRDPGTNIPVDCRGGVVPSSTTQPGEMGVATAARASRPQIIMPLLRRTIVGKDNQTNTINSDNRPVLLRVAARADHDVTMQLFKDGRPVSRPVHVTQPELGYAFEVPAYGAERFIDGHTYTVRVSDVTAPDLYAETSTLMIVNPWRFASKHTPSSPEVAHTTILMNQLPKLLAPPDGKFEANDLIAIHGRTGDPEYSGLPETDTIVAPSGMMAFETTRMAGVPSSHPRLNWTADYAIASSGFGIRMTGPWTDDNATDQAVCRVIARVSGGEWRLASEIGPNVPYDCVGPLTSGVKGWEGTQHFAVRMREPQLTQTVDADLQPDRARDILRLCWEGEVFTCTFDGGLVNRSTGNLSLGATEFRTDENYVCAVGRGPDPTQPWPRTEFQYSRGTSLAVTNGWTYGGGGRIELGLTMGVVETSVETRFHFENTWTHVVTDEVLETVKINLYPGELGYAVSTLPTKNYGGPVTVSAPNVTYRVTNGRIVMPDFEAKPEWRKTFVREMTPAELAANCPGH